MFTGLVETMGVVAAILPRPPGVRLVVRQPQIAAHVGIGDSIAVNGCCLTVVRTAGDSLEFDAGEETLRRTNLGRLSARDAVNLERSLAVGDLLGGHFVTGHIDAVGTVDQRIDDADWSTFWFRVPALLTRQMASKGSVAVDGISLTLVEVEPERFSIAAIPHTLAITTLGTRRTGDEVNVETDILAKYVSRLIDVGIGTPSRG